MLTVLLGLCRIEASAQDRRLPLAVGTMDGSPRAEQPGRRPITGPTSVLGHQSEEGKSSTCPGLSSGTMGSQLLSGRAQATQEEAMTYDMLRPSS